MLLLLCACIVAKHKLPTCERQKILIPLQSMLELHMHNNSTAAGDSLAFSQPTVTYTRPLDTLVYITAFDDKVQVCVHAFISYVFVINVALYGMLGAAINATSTTY